MTNDSKPPMFGPSFVIPANHEPRSGKSALMSQMMAELADRVAACPANLVLTIDAWDQS